MTDAERIIFKAQVLMHKENMTVLSALVPKAQADAIFDSYNGQMSDLTDEMDNLEKAEKERM